MQQPKNNKVNKIIIATSAIIIFSFLIIGVFLIISYSNQKKEEIASSNINDGQDSNLTNQQSIEKIEEEISDDVITDDFNQTFERTYGKVEIIWVDKNNNNIKQPLKPVLNKMSPIKYNGGDSNFETTDENDTSWYDYENKKWANAIDENKNFFVWIPRFAYKIVYYSDKSYTNVIGYSDARGLLKLNQNKSLTRVSANSQGLKSVGNHYILHPAFMNDLASGFINGGWDDNLDGIWVSKYEISMELNGNHTNTDNVQIGNSIISDTVKAASKPGVSSWRNISIGNCYFNAFNFNRDRESHLMKNSEWGAIAYLSYSKYGTDSNIITINSSSEYITGSTKNLAESYNYRNNQTSSGNQTGIYDLVGSAWEYVASFINNGNSRAPINAGTNQGTLMENTINTKYKTVYSHSEYDEGNGLYTSQIANSNYLVNSLKRGDAIFETSSNGYGSSSWNINASFFPQEDVPFMLRGGDFASSANAGVFSYNCSSGQPNAADGYRIVLIGKSK